MRFYAGTFLIAFSTLSFEITLSRLLSVITWYHLAFLAISTAMLGMTAGAVTVYLKPDWFRDGNLEKNLARSCLAYAVVIPFSLSLLCAVPLDLTWFSAIGAFSVVLDTAACALPFFFSGLVITVVLTRGPLPVGKLYASDLIGASFGCLFVLGGLEVLDAPSLILTCSASGVLAAACFAWRDAPALRRASVWLFCLFLAAAFVNSLTLYGIRPLIAKGRLQHPDEFLIERWNSYSRIAVSHLLTAPPQYWGASPKAPRPSIDQHLMNVDGVADTTLRRFSTLDDIEHLRYDVTNVAYHLRRAGGACIIGIGGARDVQSALLFGHERVVAIDVNPIFVDLLQNEFREFAGIADRKEVTLVADEARSYLSRTPAKYSLIQMSLIDTWAATGAGAFSFTENALYTVEGWQIFLDRLTADGIFTVSRWYNPEDLGETGRLTSLAVASLLRFGAPDPARHVAMVTSSKISTLLVSKRPFTDQDLKALQDVAAEMQFDLAIAPGGRPENYILREIVAVRSLDELNAAVADYPFNCKPPTDEDPYFFNMLRLTHLSHLLASQTGIASGNLVATFTLLGLIFSLLLLTVATIVLPLEVAARRRKQKPEIYWPGALYFSLIGAGFMYVEIALVQRLSVFLGHPVYALGVLLFAIIASTGTGSLLSERLPLARRSWVLAFPVIAAAAILLVRMAIVILVSEMIAAAIWAKALASIAVIFPLGLILGFFFPVGMRLVKSVVAAETPWYWALNGIFGVLCSALAVFFSIYLGTSTNFYLAAACYAALFFCIRDLYRAGPRSAVG